MPLLALIEKICYNQFVRLRVAFGFLPKAILICRACYLLPIDKHDKGMLLSVSSTVINRIYWLLTFNYFSKGVNIMSSTTRENYTVKDFAERIGTTPKTVYTLVKKGKLLTVNEVVSGRDTTFIKANDKDIDELRKNYGNFKVNEGNYEDILTVNESSNSTQNTVNTNNTLDLLINTNAQLQQQLMTYTNELIESKSKQLLLEDKAGREGLYLNEIKELKTENESKSIDIQAFKLESKSKSEEIQVLEKEIKSKSKLITVCIVVITLLIATIGILVVLLIKAENKPPQQQPPEVVTKIIKVDQKGNVLSTLTK